MVGVVVWHVLSVGDLIDFYPNPTEPTQHIRANMPTLVVRRCLIVKKSLVVKETLQCDNTCRFEAKKCLRPPRLRNAFVK